jgi:hypothetical protein
VSFGRACARRADLLFLGSAGVSRVGERVLAIANFLRICPSPLASEIKRKIVSARRQNQHARRVRYPDQSVAPRKIIRRRYFANLLSRIRDSISR